MILMPLPSTIPKRLICMLNSLLAPKQVGTRDVHISWYRPWCRSRLGLYHEMVQRRSQWWFLKKSWYSWFSRCRPEQYPMWEGIFPHRLKIWHFLQTAITLLSQIYMVPQMTNKPILTVQLLLTFILQCWILCGIMTKWGHLSKRKDYNSRLNRNSSLFTTSTSLQTKGRTSLVLQISILYGAASYQTHFCKIAKRPSAISHRSILCSVVTMVHFPPLLLTLASSGKCDIWL